MIKLNWVIDLKSSVGEEVANKVYIINKLVKFILIAIIFNLYSMTSTCPAV